MSVWEFDKCIVKKCISNHFHIKTHRLVNLWLVISKYLLLPSASTIARGKINTMERRKVHGGSINHFSDGDVASDSATDFHSSWCILSYMFSLRELFKLQQDWWDFIAVRSIKWLLCIFRWCDIHQLVLVLCMYVAEFRRNYIFPFSSRNHVNNGEIKLCVRGTLGRDVMKTLLEKLLGPLPRHFRQSFSQEIIFRVGVSKRN